ncbi:uncharacterized protein LOC130505598 isoform X1 [Raphanus sativus]|uniref:Uncharacterized protein LOC108806124 isoform X1 n=1 Tax=Raphanus sativus TaxID=3726 RepID=A0A9W3CXC6_RAPSA|nr:uncharacterized protein LOC108806124 isoform X1 [Raphanus sativus]XP_056856176.1 uncharacterized protein LOC130505598 isoform X1 [Raphanus sativus]
MFFVFFHRQRDGSVTVVFDLFVLNHSEGRIPLSVGVYPPIKRSDFNSQHQSFSLTPLCHLSFLRQQRRCPLNIQRKAPRLIMKETRLICQPSRKYFFQYAKLVNGTWDQKQIEREGETYWDSVVVADANRRKWLGDNPETTTNAVFVDEKWRPSYICWKSTTSLTNLDYFEFVAGIQNIKDGYTPATCIRPESFFHCHYRNIDFYFRRTQELIKELSTPPPESEVLYFQTTVLRSERLLMV